MAQIEHSEKPCFLDIATSGPKAWACTHMKEGNLSFCSVYGKCIDYDFLYLRTHTEYLYVYIPKYRKWYKPGSNKQALIFSPGCGGGGGGHKGHNLTVAASHLTRPVSGSLIFAHNVLCPVL